MSSAPSIRPGDTSYAAAGISAKFGRQLYVRPGLGIAIHNGSTDNFQRTDRIAFGSRILFEPELGIGVQVNDRISDRSQLGPHEPRPIVRPRRTPASTMSACG